MDQGGCALSGVFMSSGMIFISKKYSFDSAFGV
jgi:hypothetical protein